MSLLLDALKKAAEQKAEKIKEDIPAPRGSDETEIGSAAEDISGLESASGKLQQPQHELKDETELDDSELQTRLEKTRTEHEAGDDTGLEIADPTEAEASALSAQMQTGEDETIIFASEDVSDFLGEPELVSREQQDETDLSQLAPDQTDMSQLARANDVADAGAAPAREDDTDISQSVQPDRDQTDIRDEINSGDETDISLPVGRADEVESAEPGESVTGEDTDLSRISDPEVESVGDVAAVADEDMSLLLVEREDTNLTGRTSLTDPQRPQDMSQIEPGDVSSEEDLALIDTTRHQALPVEQQTQTQTSTQTSTQASTQSSTQSSTQTSATTGIAQDTQTQGTTTRADSTSTRTYAPDNYDRTLMKLPSDDASKIFAGMKSDSDVVMTPDYAKKVFRSKSSAQRAQHYKFYTGIALVIFLGIFIYGLFEFQAQSDNIDSSLRSLKRDPMPGIIKPGGRTEDTQLFNQAGTGVDSRTLEIIESADTVAGSIEVVTESAEEADIQAADQAEVEAVVTTGSIAIEDPAVTVEAASDLITVEPQSEISTASLTQTQAKPIASSATDTAAESGSSSNLQITLSSRIEQKDIWLREAYAAYKLGNDELAMARYNQVLELDPGNRNALLARAAINVQNNNAGAAVDDYQTLLLANPQDSLAMASLMSVTSYSPRETESQLKLMIRNEPNSPYLNFALANAYGAQDRWLEAQGYYFRALENNPGDPNYAYNLAVSLEHISQPQSAIAYYRRALENFGNGLATFNRDVVDQRIQVLSKL